MDAPTLSTSHGNNSMTFHNCHFQPTNSNHDLSHFHNIFPAPPKNLLKRSTRSETHLTDLRNFAHPSEKAISSQIHQKMKEFISNEERVKNTRLSNASSASNLRQLCDKIGCSSENIEKGDQNLLYKSFHPLSSLLLRGSNTSKKKIGNSQTISEEGETDTAIIIPSRIRKTSSASHIEFLIQDLSTSTTLDNNMLNSKELTQSNCNKLSNNINQEGLTMTIDKAKSTDNITNSIEKSILPTNWFSRPDLSNSIMNAKTQNETTTSNNGTISKTGGVFGFLGKGIFGQPVSTNENETARYILTLEQ
ncbi:Hypothetical protein SRAE_X000090300 [Strongyloides ratti]|uniref:Uncharacterized protein n=1 Tax=Strongyloides ratti TaxID=34506 RepID=A0A090LV90_STRRB|nr:Hypothetical protein SRAE_X000090300 [Strongyloides ratti]CEF71579.1 Hypothetical protein SRAE_X000090300 [Strongyloides ratti]